MPAACLTRWRWPGRLLAGLLVVLCAADTLSWAAAWTAQRAQYLETAPLAVPALLAERYPEPAWVVFHESSTPGAVELMSLAGSGPVAGLPLTDRRESHLEAAAAIAGHPWRILTTARCCRRGEALEACAARVAEAAHTSAGRTILPGKHFAVPAEHRAWAKALSAALFPRPDRRRQRWRVVEGQGEGPLPCAVR